MRQGLGSDNLDAEPSSSTAAKRCPLRGKRCTPSTPDLPHNLPKFKLILLPHPMVGSFRHSLYSGKNKSHQNMVLS